MDEFKKDPVALLDVFRDLGAPGCHQMTADDLDWLFGDQDAAHFLQHLIRSVDGSSMRLDADRVDSWNALQKKRPEDILRGRALDEAVKVFEDEGSKFASELSDQELYAVVARLEEETDLQRAHLDQMDRLAATMSKTKAAKVKIKNKMPRLESSLDQELRAKHEKVLVENQRFNSALEDLKNTIIGISGHLQDCGRTTINPKLISDANLDLIKKRENHLVEQLKTYFREHFLEFGFADDVDRITASLIREKTRDEHDRCFMELVRLKAATSDSEYARISFEAMVEGSKAANSTVQKISTKYVMGQLNTDSEWLQTSALELEDIVNALKLDLAEMTNQWLKRCCDRLADVEVDYVVVTEKQVKEQRQRLLLQRLEPLLEQVLIMRSRQNVLASLLLQERTCLESVGAQLMAVDKDISALTAEMTATSLASSAAMEAQRTRDGQLSIANDRLLATIYSILSDPSESGALKNAREGEVLRLLAHHEAERSRVDQRKDDLESRLASKQAELASQMPMLRASLDIGSGDRCQLTGKELSVHLSKLHSETKAFEAAVKSASADWEKELKRMKQEDSGIKVQKRLWIDYMCNPALLEANVAAVVKRAGYAPSK